MVKRELLGRCHLLALAVFVPISPLAAQSTPYPPAANPPGAVVQPLPVIDPLAMNLKILAQNPYDVNALTQAGLGALEIGDAQAASGFLARADELSPRDGRIKAALATALTLVERPQEALHTFEQAVALGYPERMIAKDRGLAHDLNGDQKRAQKDYVLAEKHGLDPETIRRHALSLGITGQKEEALKLLDPLIRRSDQSAWRARAFVLALNGDMPQADRIIRAATPPSMVAGMSTFLRRLPSLTPAQRASAVNFGTIPTTGPIYTAADSNETFRSVGNGQMDGLLTPSETARVQTASVSGTPRLSRAEQRQAERREKELAKLAAKGAKASGVKVASATPSVTMPPATLPSVAIPPVRPVSPPPPTPVTPPTQTAGLGQRVGARLGPVDPARLPEELRPASAGSQPAAPARIVVVQGATQLPPPDGARPKVEPVRVASLDPKLTPVPVSAPPPPAPKPIVPAPEVKPPTPAPPVTNVVTPPPASNPFALPPGLPPAEPRQVAASSAFPPATPQPVASPPVRVTVPVTPEPKPAQVAVLDVKPMSPPVTLPSVTPPSVALPPATTLPPLSPQPPAPMPALVKPVDLPPSAPAGAPTTTTATTVPVTPTSPPAVAPAPTTAPLVAPPAAPPALGSATPSPPPLIGPPATLANAPSSFDPPEAPKLADATPQPGFVADAVPPETTPAAAPEPEPEPEKAPPGARLSSILDGIEKETESAAAPLPSIAEIRAQKLAAQRKADADAKAKLDKEAAAKLAKEEAAKKAEEDAAKIKANPGRVWVQVAMGANRSGLSVTYRKLKGDAPKALGDRQAWFMPFRSTYRLLVGPMKGPGDARQLVTALSKEGVSATTYSSEPGQEVTRLGGR